VLKAFPVVCLPNTAILSGREVNLLRTYVEEGGKLLVTGQTGQFGPKGESLERSSLDELIGARVRGRLQSEDNWVSVEATTTFPDDPRSLSADLRPHWPFLVKGPATVYEPTTASPFGKLYKPHRTQRQRQGKMGTEWPMSADRPVGPAALINRVGKGTVVTCAASPDYALASEHALVENRVLFRNLFQALGAKRRVTVNAPANVEAVVTDDPATRQIRIHLLAYNPTPRTTPQKNRPYILPGMIEDAPIFRASVTTDKPVQAAEALNPSTQLQMERSTVQAMIEDVHEVLLISY
jgi:hypothetical protein